LLDLLNGLFDYILIDCGTVLDERTAKIFEQSAMVFVLYTLRLPVIKKTQRLLQLLDEIGYPKEKRKLILNAFDPEAEVLMDETESIFETKVFMKIMEDHPSANTAVNSGIPMVIGAPKTVVVQTFHNLAYFLIGKKPPKKNNGSKFNLAAFSLTGVGETWASLKDKWSSPKVSPNTPQEIKT
jgi:pilus assembly protein CpaE